MILRTHGSAPLRGGREELFADYQQSDGDVGDLRLRLDEPQTAESVHGAVRLDPHLADEYVLLEFETSTCMFLVGAQAIVALDRRSLVLRSTVGLEYREWNLVGQPWFLELQDARSVVFSSDRRVWCVDEFGAVRWMWSCSSLDPDRTISGPPSLVGSTIRVPFYAGRGVHEVLVDLRDGLPRRA